MAGRRRLTQRLRGERKSGLAAFRDAEWLRKHSQQMHVKELASLPGHILSAEQKLFASLPHAALKGVIETEVLLLGAETIWILERAKSEFDRPHYLVYPLTAWNEFTKDFPLTFTQRRDSNECLYGTGSYCWAGKAAPTQRRTTLYATVALSSMLLLAGCLVYLILQRLVTRRRDHEDQLFILRTLTHELRTPATSMNLALEPFRQDFDRLGERCQTAFLRLCDDVQRLNKTIAGSSRYLRLHGPRAAERFEIGMIASINDFVASTLEPYGGKVEAHPLSVDCSLRSDPFWLATCLSNLVENALQHGSPPVRVALIADRFSVRFDVIDAGRSLQSEKSLRSLTKAFSRRNGSRGLGLGLSIVDKTIKGLGGELFLESSPTTRFSLRVPLGSPANGGST